MLVVERNTAANTLTMCSIAEAHFSRREMLRTFLPWLMLLVLSSLEGLLSHHRVEASDIDFPQPSPTATLVASAEVGSKTQIGAYTVYQLRGNVRIVQGAFEARANQAVLWIDEEHTMGDRKPQTTICCLDGQCRIRWSDQQSLEAREWMGKLYSLVPVNVRVENW